ncbi:MAG: hypothetical protein R2765_00385 [Ferruginibacter sp.]
MLKYGIIGYPLTHSFSRQYFNNKIEKDDIEDAVYENYPLLTIDEFPRLLKANPELKGLSVTIPYKESVLQFINDFSDEVKKLVQQTVLKLKKTI